MYFCRTTFKQGGVCIYVSNDIQFQSLDLDQFNREKDLEICAINIHLPCNNLVIICIYRSPTGNFNCFLKQSEYALDKLYKVSFDLILCGDFNINHLEGNSWQHHLKSLFASFYLSDIVKFPTRISNNSITLTDNFYINTSRLHFSIHPITNGLSDYDAQVPNLSFIIKEVHSQPFSFLTKTNGESICNFKDLLSYENWEDVFLENNVNIIFNNFLNTYPRIFNTCFPTAKTHVSKA